jgi:pimeloyl-ACP methyl ester carboxylesterase
VSTSSVDVQPHEHNSITAVDVDSETEQMRVSGRSFPVVDHGSGPTVVLLHGFPDTRRLWRHQIPALADAGFRVLAPDLRGFGDAPKPEAVEAYELQTVVEEDVVGLLDAVGVETAHVVGHGVDRGGDTAGSCRLADGAHLGNVG